MKHLYQFDSWAAFLSYQISTQGSRRQAVSWRGGARGTPTSPCRPSSPSWSRTTQSSSVWRTRRASRRPCSPPSSPGPPRPSCSRSGSSPRCHRPHPPTPAPLRGTYRLVQLEFTSEIIFLNMLYDRCNGKNGIRSTKHHKLSLTTCYSSLATARSPTSR